jgi:hypothetical protein
MAGARYLPEQRVMLDYHSGSSQRVTVMRQLASGVVIIKLDAGCKSRVHPSRLSFLDDRSGNSDLMPAKEG